MTYDKNNIFAKIISGEINTDRIYEDDKVIAINDINPAAPIHILIIPKENYVDFADFVNNANSEYIAHYYKIINKIAKDNGADEYRLVTNKGAAAGQSVFHFHTHLLANMSTHELINKNL
ncbi:MAG: HIT domain-containing protein [Rickettsiaceae bacterium]|nr:HIT domain-containing protein [Rickettsiaceae bacterium]